MKTQSLFFTAIIFFIIFLISSCKKDELKPIVQISIEISSVSQTQISITAQVPKYSQESGAFLALHENPGVDDTHVIRSAQNGVLNINFGVEPATEYFLKAYATLNGETYYSDVVSATTYASLSTKDATEIELHQAKVNGEIYLAKDAPVHFWFEWGESHLNKKTEERQISGEGPTSVSALLSNLSWGRNYNYRLAIRSDNKTFYGEQKNFKTSGEAPSIKSIEIDVSELNQIHFKAYINSNLLPSNVLFSYGDVENNYPHYLSENLNGDSVEVQFSITTDKAQIYYFRLNVSNDLGQDNADTSAVSLAFVFEGHGYKAAKIGDQYWLAENFKGLHYQNGDPIPYIYENEDWMATNSGAVCYYEHNLEYFETYGALYNWYAATDPRDLAPPGWRVPTREDFRDLADYIESLDGIGGWTSGAALKAKGLEHWGINVGKGENNMDGDWFGFRALGAGARANFSNYPDSLGMFGALQYWVYFWGDYEFSGLAYSGSLNGYNAFFSLAYSNKNYGFSIRFIKE